MLHSAGMFGCDRVCVSECFVFGDPVELVILCLCDKISFFGWIRAESEHTGFAVGQLRCVG